MIRLQRSVIVRKHYTNNSIRKTAKTAVALSRGVNNMGLSNVARRLKILAQQKVDREVLAQLAYQNFLNMNKIFQLRTAIQGVIVEHGSKLPVSDLKLLSEILEKNQ